MGNDICFDFGNNIYENEESVSIHKKQNEEQHKMATSGKSN